MESSKEISENIVEAGSDYSDDYVVSKGSGSKVSKGKSKGVSEKEFGSDYSDDDDTDDATICLVTNCPKCGVGKLSRNAKIEKIVKTFHLMMQFRQYL